MKRALCIWLPNWPVQRLAAARPELKGQPIVLYETYRGARRAIACSAQAEALGIAPGMPLAEAMAISTEYSVLRACEKMGTGSEPTCENREKSASSEVPVPIFSQPEAEVGRRKSEVGRVECKVQIANCKLQNRNPVTSPHSSFIIHHSSFSPRPSPLTPFPSDPLADREALEELTAWCQRFSPIVGIEDSPSPESLLLDVTGLEHLFGGEAALAEKMVRDFADRGLVVRVAIADTLGAAWAVARFCNCKLKNAKCKFAICNLQFAISNLQSSICSSSFLVPPGQVSTALAPLPIEALRLPAQVVELLHSLGVYRIGQLEPLPRAELAARFGASIALRWDQATGQAAEPIPASPPPAELQARESLEYPTTRRDAVELILQQLIGQVAQKLLGCGRGAMRLQCRLECQTPLSGHRAQHGRGRGDHRPCSAWCPGVRAASSPRPLGVGQPREGS
jgi:nucleotidyltransferase/DNA polymerase involved in DNA repair